MERSDQALNKVREFLARRDSAQGGRIPPERELASDLGVGRRSLRRALDVLEQEGRIRRQQGRGTFIEPAMGARSAHQRPPAPGLPHTPAELSAAITQQILDYTNPLEVIEVRMAIEPVLARLAAMRASQAEIQRLEKLAARTREAADPETYERADALFHRTIAEATRNSMFLAFFDTTRASQRDAAWRRLGEHGHCYKRQAVYAQFHESIAAAIAARDGREACSLMQRHLADVQQYLHEQAFPRTEPAQ
jgi:DNA-binding FadR family transcriptional regulator